MPTMIDEYAIMDSDDRSYVMETLDEECLIYMGVDYSRQCYALKYFDGNTSSVVIEGDQIYVAFNSEKTLANICVYHNLENNLSWYRMTLDGYPALEYVCDDIMDTMYYTNNEPDFQTMVENDIIICMSDCRDEEGYYSVDLYVHGQWRENLIEKLPWRSIGPFGIKVGAGVSFFMISTADLVTLDGRYYNRDSVQFTFYRYKNGSLREVSEELRLQTALPETSVDSIYCINDEVLFRYNPNYAELKGWVSFKETGEVEVIDDNSEWASVNAAVLTNAKGEQILVYSGLDGSNYPLYAYSNGTLKILIGDTEHMEVFERLGKRLLVANIGNRIYYMEASDMDIDTIENDFSPIYMQKNLLEVTPYSDNELLYTVSGEHLLLYWNGKNLRQ